MSRVVNNERNQRHCRCPSCPVLEKSSCDKKKVLFCATGKAQCKDLDNQQACSCPGCLVWEEYNLGTLYFCINGSAD
ncbi:MAG: DUF2769 domain-containing protein [Patescibacteria group bacterium]|nr:DUF2769 domain-containing protein [Patescibacteria group bacterium]